MEKVRLSFIIPALNEEKNIKEAIGSIKNNISGRYDYEIIVVDNGSKDSTVEIAKSEGVRILHKPGLTIGALRNAGVDEMHGDIIIFLDADIILKSIWAKNIGDVISLLAKDSMVITGSMVGYNNDANWIEKNWSDIDRERPKNNFINSGHMIMTKSLFTRLGGFNKSLVTGEDYELCRRAERNGVKIINKIELEVEHKDYPKTLYEFFKRERWHGRDDVSSFSSIISSKTAILTLIQFIVLIISIISTIIFKNLWILSIYVLFVTVISAGTIFYKMHKINRRYFIYIFLYAIYFIGRIFAFFDAIARKRHYWKNKK